MSVDTEALDHLLHLLSTLKKDIDMDDVLSNGTLWKLLPIASLRETMHRMSSINSVLQALSTGMWNSTAALELQASNAVENPLSPYPRECQGLLSLPNEVLCIITEEIARDQFMHKHQRSSKFLAFSQTCRKVREATLSFPVLWTTVSTTFTSSQVEAFLSRIQNLPLVVMVDIPRSNHLDLVPSLQIFVNQILRHSHRWRALHVSLYKLVPDSPEFDSLRYLGDNVGTLPALQFLSIELPVSVEDAEIIYEKEDFHFYKSWTMPVLRSFAFRNFVPRVVLPRTVTSVEAALTSNFRNSSQLLDFLQSAPQLRDLKLDVDECDDFDFGSPVILDAVESLEVTCYPDFDNDVGYVTVCNVMTHLVFPNLKNLKIIAYVREWDDMRMCIDALFFGQKQFEKVDSVILDIVREEQECCDVGDLFTKVPNLKDLTVNVDNAYPPVLWGSCDGIPPNIRTLRLKLGGIFVSSSIFEILEETEVQSLEFTHIQSFLRSKIQNRIGKTKLTWKEELDQSLTR